MLPPYDNYGVQLNSNKSWTGMAKALIENEADIILADYSVNNLRGQVSDTFSQYQTKK